MCQRPDDAEHNDPDDPWIACCAGRAGCGGWVHLSCAVEGGLSAEAAEAVELEDKARGRETERPRGREDKAAATNLAVVNVMT